MRSGTAEIRPRLILADDHDLVLDRIRRLLESEFEVVGAVTSAQALVDVAEKVRPDAVVLDISMPVLSGFEAVRRLRSMGCTAKIVLLTIHGDMGLADEAFALGASGYVLKACADKDLASALRKALRGGRYISSALCRASGH